MTSNAKNPVLTRLASTVTIAGILGLSVVPGTASAGIVMPQGLGMAPGLAETLRPHGAPQPVCEDGSPTPPPSDDGGDDDGDGDGDGGGDDSGAGGAGYDFLLPERSPFPGGDPLFPMPLMQADAGAQIFLACVGRGGATPLQGTENIVNRIDAMNAACSRLDLAYRLDCLANQYAALARQIPNGGSTFELQRTLRKVAADLRSLADATIEPDAPRVNVPRYSDNVPAIANRRVGPVRQDRIAEANAAALAILEEATTVLLRSSQNSAVRQVLYQRVAQGVDSSKVLLRSA